MAYRIDYTTRETERFNFGAVDGKRRTIGARVTYASGEFTAERANGLRQAPQGSPESGPAFCMTVHATRDNNDFGAIQGWQVFATAAARDAAKAKYLDGARKRAAKLAGK